MALLTEFFESDKQAPSVHRPTECGYSVFQEGGRTFVQFDTYGSAERKLQGKISQSMQLDRAAAEQVIKILGRAFPDLAH